MRKSPRTAKAVAAFVPHFATAVHIESVSMRAIIWSAAAIGWRFRMSRGGREMTGLRGIVGCRFRGFADMRESPRTAKAVAAFVPHFATAVHIESVSMRAIIWSAAAIGWRCVRSSLRDRSPYRRREHAEHGSGLNDPRAALPGDVGPDPVEEDDGAIAHAHEEEEMDEEPHEPSEHAA